MPASLLNAATAALLALGGAASIDQRARRSSTDMLMDEMQWADMESASWKSFVDKASRPKRADTERQRNVEEEMAFDRDFDIPLHDDFAAFEAADGEGPTLRSMIQEERAAIGERPNKASPSLVARTASESKAGFATADAQHGARAVETSESKAPRQQEGADAPRGAREVEIAASASPRQQEGAAHGASLRDLLRGARRQ
mmetsp:Transcript_7602/g.18825  ORF Transcript_7602/g.18825 Transcript_7602/m.18825 type:complete len:200 (+) Transcript_7602:87-686(+)